MRKYGLSDITFMQFIFIIHGAQVGIGIFSLPKVLADKAGTDGWISLALGWVINVTASIIIVLIFRRYPDDTLADLMIRLFGKFIGKVLLIPFIIYFAFFVWNILTLTMLYIKQWFLPLTPDYIVMILLTIPGFMIAGRGVRILGRYCELVFYLFIPMFLFLLIPLKDSHWIHLLPFYKEGWGPIFKGAQAATFSFLGFEVVFFIYPFLQKKHLAIRGVVIANTITFFLYLAVTLICFAFFSPDGITSYNQPVFNLLKNIEFPFLERFDMVFLAIYLFVVTTAWIPYMFGVAFNTAHLLGKKDTSSFGALFLLLIIILVYLLHPSWYQTDQAIKFISNAGLWFTYVFPLFLFIYMSVLNSLQRSES